MVAPWRSLVCFRQGERLSKLCGVAYPHDEVSDGERGHVVAGFCWPVDSPSRESASCVRTW